MIKVPTHRTVIGGLMSARLVAAEIARFLASAEAEVLCITGKWGVGKTYSWNFYLDEAKKNERVALKNYSYVSLFGMNSLEDLRKSIFESTESTQSSSDALEKQAAAWVNKIVRSAPQILPKAPVVGEYAGIISGFYFHAVRNQIVCIDDLERAGRGLDAKDVLGLASFLKERRGCKVVLLLNSGELSDDDRKTYDKLLEKVADAALEFAPTAAESADIGISKGETFAVALSRCVVSFNVTNIRVIKKIERLAKQLEAVLTEFDQRVFGQALQTAALFGWAVYQPGNAPPVEFLRKYNRIADVVGRDKAKPDPHHEWRSLLTSYGFTATDEFDLTILDGIERGAFDAAAIRAAAGQLEEGLKRAEREGSVDEAWSRYHGSFDDNANEVLDGLERAHRENYDVVSPMNMNGVVELLRELGRSKQADSLVQYYIEKRNAPRHFYDLNGMPFRDQIRDAALVDAFTKKYSSFADPRAPEDVLLEISEKSGWNDDDVAKLTSLTEDDLYNLFKSIKGRNLSRIVASALQFHRIGGISPDLYQVADRATAALKRIGMESPINSRRVRVYGIAVDPIPPKKGKRDAPAKGRKR